MKIFITVVIVFGIIISSVGLGTFIFDKVDKSSFERHRQELFGNDTYVKIPRPDDCKKVITEEVLDNSVRVVYQTKDGDVAVATWNLVYEGTARLSDSKPKKDKNIPVPVTTNGPSRGDAVDKIKKFVNPSENEE